MKFKVGDKVKIIKNVGSKTDDRYMGDVSRIVSIYKDYKLDNIAPSWCGGELELVEERKMDIKEVCRVENVGNKFKDDRFGDVWGVTKDGSELQLVDSKEDDITNTYVIGDLLNLKFEEVISHKEITGKEALKIMLDGGVAYDTEDCSIKHYICEDEFVSKSGDTGYYDRYRIGTILKMKWYIKQ